MIKMIISREFNSNSLEIWKVEVPNISSINYLVIADQKRPSTLEDYPWFSEADKEFFEPRENFIKIQFISEKDLESLNLSHSEISNVTENLLGHVAQGYCNWNIDFLIKNNAEDYINELLENHGFNRDNTSKFKYLSQD